MTQENSNYGRNQNIINQPGTVNFYGQTKRDRPRNEQLLLQAVKDEVNGRLAQSLHNAVLINLGKQAQPQQVKRPWDAEVKIGSREPEALTAETKILEVFTRQEIAGKLLILGDPGAGKTTTMLDLAQALVQQAETDANAAIPVLLNLSSWKDPRLTITDWLIEELKSKYGVRKDIGKQWLADKQLLPLLDGLDEVKPEHQESCVQLINQWLQSELRSMQLVVCSRREEYDNYQTCLELNGAILLQSLTDPQIQNYLTAVQQPDLWQFLQHDATLLKLLRTPLLLSITILSSGSLSLEQWQQVTSTEKRLELLLDAYVEKMLHREMNNRIYKKHKAPTGKETRQWLIILARQLQKESQTEFLIEKMQPKTWLLTRNQKQIYRLIIGLSGGLIFGLIFGLSGEQNTRLIYGLIGGSSSGLIYGLSVGLANIETIEAIQLSMSHEARREIIKQLHIGLIYGPIYGLTFGLITVLIGWLTYGDVALRNTLIGGLIGGPLLGLSGGLIFGLSGGLKGSEVEVKAYPNQGIRKSAVNFLLTTLIGGLIGGLVGGLIACLISGLSNGLFVGLFVGLIFGLIFGLSKGGTACIQHPALRFVLFGHHLIPWNYARFLDYCTERLILQRIGGRYRFIHKLLQDHFAAMPLEREVRGEG